MKNQPEIAKADGDKSSDKQKGEEQPLTFKERIKALDEKKKKAFVNYKWWEHGLTNSKNVNQCPTNNANPILKQKNKYKLESSS